MSTLATETFHGLPLGINQAQPPHETPDTSARWIQDALLDRAGEVRQRGPITEVASIATSIAEVPQGMVQTVVDDGSIRVGFLTGTATPQFQLLSKALSSVKTYDWGSEDWSSQAPIYAARAALGGGMLIGTAPQPLPAATGSLGYWRGGAKNDYSTGTITATQGSQTITGSGTSWTANVDVGSFLFMTASASGGGQWTLLGRVGSVDSNTGITLVHGSLADATAGSHYITTAIRGVSVRAGKGRITATTDSTTITGANTKFLMMTDIGETWSFFRARDMAFIGEVDFVTNNTSLTLTSSAAVDVSNELYIAVRLAPTANYSVTQDTVKDGLGILTTTYQGRQFYANLPIPYSTAVSQSNLSSRVWFSELHDFEAVDVSAADGDFFDVTSQVAGDTAIMAIIGLQNALAILKENELFAVYGSDPTQFALRKIADVGTISPMSVVQYGSGIIFAARDGIYHFDGTAIQQLSGALGAFYRDAVSGFDSATDRAYGAVFRDHYLLSLTDFASGYSTVRGSAETPITAGTLVMNLLTGGISWFTNVQFRGWANLPPSSGFDAWFVMEDDADNSTAICDANDLWTGSGPDAVTALDQVAGPKFYVEMKRYDIRDAQRLKSFKQLAMHYILQGDTLSMDVIGGTDPDAIGETTRLPWQIQPTMKNRRLQFMVRDTHVGFRLYPTNDAASALTIGPFAIGFKLQRIGRP